MEKFIKDHPFVTAIAANVVATVAVVPLAVYLVARFTGKTLPVG